jgi:DNA polymerase III delta prime subunit
MIEDFLWVEKYRPKTVEETILPADLKTTFAKFVSNGDIPNLILTGGAGVGKTTIAKAMLEELKCSYIVINGSMNGNIDTLRNEIKNFASTMSFKGGRKYVILDEADYLNPTSTQPALRNFMEEFSANCGFILTCNFLNRIIQPLHSRCSVIQFKISNADKPKLAAQFFKRVGGILQKEGIEFDPPVVAEVIKKHFPDWRRTLNELQRYSVTGKIDTGILANVVEVSIKTLLDTLRSKDFSTMRKWVNENNDNDSSVIFRNLFDNILEYVEPASVPVFIMLLSEYQYKAAFVANPEINMAAFLTEVMASCDIK